MERPTGSRRLAPDPPALIKQLTLWLFYHFQSPLWQLSRPPNNTILWQLLLSFSLILLRNLKSAHWHELDCPSRLCKSWYLNDCCIFIFCALFSARHTRLMNHTASGVRRFPHLSWTLHLFLIMRAAVCANIHRQNKYYALGILSNIKKKSLSQRGCWTVLLFILSHA